MPLDTDAEREYLLLRNYQENNLLARGVLLRISFVALDQIDSDSWIIKFTDPEKARIRPMIQIDIISKVMMYIEDLAIFAESFRQGKNFYDFLDKRTPEDKELGKVIEEFFNNLESYEEKDFYRIMSYIDPIEIKIDGDCMKLLHKHLKANIDELKRIMKQIGDFGRTHHPVFRRFKHAGFPVVLDNSLQNPGFLEGFDSTMLVSKGPDPMQDIIPIPYSKKVLDAYIIIIDGIQKILTDMVTNRIVCIERGINGIIPPQTYAPYLFNREEWLHMEKKVDEFLIKNPIKDLPKKLNFGGQVRSEDIKWYLELSEFLEKCKKIKEENEKYAHRCKNENTDNKV